MKCHYEVLGVSRIATNEELTEAYENLRKKGEGDSRLVQLAYEVLSDPKEREWYDKYRQNFLRGENPAFKDDNCLNLYPFFTTLCFKDYTDEKYGFYTVYRKVFERISIDDAHFMLNAAVDVPRFGSSKSSYERIVQPFYAYWENYSTVKTYSWVSIYDTEGKTNLRIVATMKMENQKYRESLRETRNEEVRQLVAFVKKRDKRVQAHEEQVLEQMKQISEEDCEEKVKKNRRRRRRTSKRSKGVESKEPHLSVPVEQFAESFTGDTACAQNFEGHGHSNVGASGACKVYSNTDACTQTNESSFNIAASIDVQISAEEYDLIFEKFKQLSMSFSDPVYENTVQGHSQDSTDCKRVKPGIIINASRSGNFETSDRSQPVQLRSLDAALEGSLFNPGTQVTSEGRAAFLNLEEQIKEAIELARSAYRNGDGNGPFVKREGLMEKK